MSATDGSNPAGREPADTSRAERVAHIGATIGALYSVAHALDAEDATEGLKAFIKAREFFQRTEDAVVREVEAIGERVRSREGVHGEDSQAPEVAASSPDGKIALGG